jgi:ribosomal protein S18 acetylase RimI-like enzyme
MPHDRQNTLAAIARLTATGAAVPAWQEPRPNIMTCTDWRDAPADMLTPLLAAERQRWIQHLWWDLRPSLDSIERARTAGELPGLIVCNRRTGEPLAWSFYVLAHGVLQIGALAGATAGAVRMMLEEICVSAEAQLARGLSCFLFPTSASVASALARQRFALNTYRYLCLPLDGAERVRHSTAALRPWRPDDTAAAVRLLARAYAGDAGAQCFAPRARLDEWAHYVGQLLRGPASGHFAPEESFVAEDDAGQLAGAVLVTRVAPDTAHVAQLAVHPARRGVGVGAALVAAACATARARGATRVTLLANEQNVAASALCARLRFVESSSSFIYAHRGPVARRFSPRTVAV